MAPEEKAMSEGNLLGPFESKLGHVREVALAGLHLPRVDVSSFEVGEEELDWGCIVAVRPGEEDRELELLIHLQAVAGRLVRRVVDHDHGVMTPGWPLIV